MSAWPASVFDAPALAALDERGRDEVERAGRWRKLEDGEVLYRAGDPSDALYVVAAGALCLSAVRRGDERESEIRRARRGDTLGEEAALAGAQRAATATAVERAELAEIPMGVLTRALERSGGGDALEREERALRRAASRDVLGTLAFARDLPVDDLELMLDGVRWTAVPRRARVYGVGDPSDAAYLVVNGLLQLQTEHDGKIQVRAYLSRGDLFGDEEALAGERRRVHAVAQGDCQLLSVPRVLLRTLVDRNPGVIERIQRVHAEREARQRRAVDASVKTTQHVFHDLYRLQMARSLLAIDQDRCVRCGHCAWACADTHDGVARLVRRGDKIVTGLGSAASAPKSLMLPSSCQHCANPACMIDCPTGAIGRDPEGDVFIREALCTGCGACAKACPWENIRMAPGPEREVAVKCDLCKGMAAPACVSACPTEAISRLDPQRDFREVSALLGAGASRVIAPDAGRGLLGLAPSLALALAVGLLPTGVLLRARGISSPGTGLAFVAGVAALFACFGLVLYALPKRLGRLLPARTGETGPRSLVAPQYRVHLALGLASVAAVALHTGGRLGSGAAGALGVAFWLTAGLGGLGALAYRALPPRLSRLERKGSLPEDLAQERDALFDRLHRATSGTSELVKAIADKILVPYARAPLGPLALLASGRSSSAERAALRARVDSVLEGRGAERLDGLDELLRIVVELRALPARRLLTFCLRAFVPAHVLATGILLVLIVLHVVQMTMW